MSGFRSAAAAAGSGRCPCGGGSRRLSTADCCGPLLRGEGAPVPVAVQSLQLLPTQWALLAFVVRNYNDEGKRIAEAWQSSEMKELSQIINDYAHAEVARQQGGQADG